jgi:hypothetical protein
MGVDTLLAIGQRLRRMYDEAAAPVPDEITSLLDDLGTADREGPKGGDQIGKSPRMR